MSDTLTFLRGLVIGVLVGSVAALWKAPRSGEETRQKIRQQLQSIVNQVQGETVEDSLELGKAIAHQKQLEAAKSFHLK